MRTVEIDLFGALRDVTANARLVVDTPASTIGELRAQLQGEAESWPAQMRALLPRSAFASATTVLRDGDALPGDGRLALLPPVSGG